MIIFLGNEKLRNHDCCYNGRLKAEDNATIHAGAENNVVFHAAKGKEKNLKKTLNLALCICHVILAGNWVINIVMIQAYFSKY